MRVRKIAMAIVRVAVMVYVAIVGALYFGQRRLIYRPDTSHPDISSVSVTGVQAPIFIAQGGRDEVVPPALGRKLYDAAPDPKEFRIAPEAGHNNLLDFGVIEAAIGFVKRHLPSG